MRHILLLISLYLTGYNSVSAQRTLLGQSYTFNEGGLCTTTYKFVDDSLFKCGYGCEQFYNTYYGRYKVRKDTLFLEHGIGDTYVRILRIETKETQFEGVVLRFVNQYGKNISNYFRACLVREPKLRYSLSYDPGREALTIANLVASCLEVSTLQTLGIPTELQADFSHPIEITYHLQMPPFVYPLLNKDIQPRGKGTLLIKSDEMIPINDIHSAVFYLHEPVIFKKDNRTKISTL